jgi:REP element-mobilizing transposase RayT
VILNDLSPAATFIAANYTLPFDVEAFAKAGKQLLEELEQEIGWMYETLHVEPASSRLLELTGFVSSTTLTSSLPQPVPSKAGQQDAGPTQGISSFTQRQDNLPHWQLPGAFYFLTFNTHQRRQLSPQARQIAMDALQFFAGQRLDFIAAVVMPDHVHALIRPREKAPGIYWDLAELMHSIKSYSANRINEAEGSRGQKVWQTETYDRIVRDEREYAYILQYIAYNPVMAGLVGKPEEYPWLVFGNQVKAAGWKPAPLGKIEYTVWSEVFTCPECAGEVNFTEEALDEESKRVKESFPCPHCGAALTKSRLERLYSTKLDPITGKAIKVPKRVPTLISYVIGKTRYEKKPTADDLAVLQRIESLPLPSQVPTIEIPPMHMTHERARMDYAGVTHIHHFYLPRAAQAMGRLWEKAKAHPDPRIRSFLLFMVEQAVWGLSVLNRYQPIQQGRPGGSQVNRQLTGVYYVASQHAECSPWYNLGGKLDRLVKAFSSVGPASSRPGQQDAGPTAMITTGTAARLSLPDDCIDYIFTDPPFGENIYYADLNFLVESWHGVTTDAQPEVIIDRFKHKGLPEYQHLMQRCFAEYHRVLKPGRWMTVVFSNSKAAVWNAIQVALQQAGFVVAEVTALDKQQGSYRQVTSTTAVKQDLVISAYKPNGGLEERFSRTGATVESAWDFVQTHLRQLAVSKVKNGALEFIVERDPRRIFDRMVAWFVRHHAPVPLSSQEFQEGLRQRFCERDSMIFLPEQAAEYDKKRALAAQAPQIELFVCDERSAIDWLTDFLKRRPSTYQEIHPEFITQLGAGWRRHEAKPELAALLEDNFLKYDGTGEVPSQIHSYLSSNYKELRGLAKHDPRLIAKAKDRWYVPDPNKAQDLEKKREKALLKEFETYLAHPGRRLKEFRLEVLRAGFKAAWSKKDYATIIKVAQKIPDEALQEDEKLLLWYDQALTRVEGGQ